MEAEGARESYAYILQRQPPAGAGDLEHRSGPGLERPGGRPAAGGLWPQPAGRGPPGGEAPPSPGPAERPDDLSPAGRRGPVVFCRGRTGLAGRGHYSGHCGVQHRHLCLAGGQRPESPGGPTQALVPQGQGPAGRRGGQAGQHRSRPRRHRLAGSGRLRPCRRPYFMGSRVADGRVGDDRRVRGRGQAGRQRSAPGHPLGRAEKHGHRRHRRHRGPGEDRRDRHRHGLGDGEDRRPPPPPAAGADAPPAEDGRGLPSPLPGVRGRVRRDVRRGDAPAPGHSGHVSDGGGPGRGGDPGGPARHRHHRAGHWCGAHGQA